MDTKSSNKIKTSAETQREYLRGRYKYLQGRKDNTLQLGPGGSGIPPQGAGDTCKAMNTERLTEGKG
jgi:hypothetical protein